MTEMATAPAIPTLGALLDGTRSIPILVPTLVAWFPIALSWPGVCR